jgi:hypothetical protein
MSWRVRQVEQSVPGSRLADLAEQVKWPAEFVLAAKLV